MKTVLRAILAFFGPAPDSIRGYLNADELARVLMTSLGASSALGLGLNLGIDILSGIGANAAVIFPGRPALAVVAAFIAVHLADAIRRYQHGAPALPPADPVPPAPPQLVAEPGPGPVAPPPSIRIVTAAELVDAVRGGIYSAAEARAALGLPPLPPGPALDYEW